MAVCVREFFLGILTSLTLCTHYAHSHALHLFPTPPPNSFLQPSYRAWATDAAHQRQGAVTKYANPTSAATAAAKAIFTKYPDEAKLCGLGAQPAVRTWLDLEEIVARRGTPRL